MLSSGRNTTRIRAPLWFAGFCLLWGLTLAQASSFVHGFEQGVPANITVESFVRIGGKGLPGAFSEFGMSTSPFTDVDGDGNVREILVGAPSARREVGAIVLLSLNEDGSLSRAVNITDGEAGIPSGTFRLLDFFGYAISGFADLQLFGGLSMPLRGGLQTVAVGAPGAYVELERPGIVALLTFNESGLVQSSVLITNGKGGLPSNTLSGGEGFGQAIAGFTDLDGDGFAREIAVLVGSTADAGSVYVLFLTEVGHVDQFVVIGGKRGGVEFWPEFGMSGFTPPPGDPTSSQRTTMFVTGNTKDTSPFFVPSGYACMTLGPSGDVESWNFTETFPALPVISFSQSTATFNTPTGPVGPVLLIGTGGGGWGATRDPASRDPAVETGSVVILFLNSTGGFSAHTTIANGQGGLPPGTMPVPNAFGSAVSNVVPWGDSSAVLVGEVYNNEAFLLFLSDSVAVDGQDGENVL